MPRKTHHRKARRHAKKPTINRIEHQLAAIKVSARKPHRYFDIDDYNLDWTGSFNINNQGASYAFALNHISQGAGFANRIGNQVMNKHLNIKINLATNYLSNSAVGSTAYPVIPYTGSSLGTYGTLGAIRIALLWQKSAEFTGPSSVPIANPVESVVYNPTSYLASTQPYFGTFIGSGNDFLIDPYSNILANRNPDAFDTYTVLHDKVYNPQIATSRRMEVHINKRMNAKTTFAPWTASNSSGSSNTNAYTNYPTSGLLWLCFWRDLSTPDTVSDTLITEFTSRLTFTD